MYHDEVTSATLVYRSNSGIGIAARQFIFRRVTTIKDHFVIVTVYYLPL